MQAAAVNFTLVAALGVLALVAYREDTGFSKLASQVLGLARPWCWDLLRRGACIQGCLG
jgi:hypothetical protein